MTAMAAPPPPQDSCPVCEMVRKHETGCPFEGLSMDEANRLYPEYLEEQRLNAISSEPGSSLEPPAAADESGDDPRPVDNS